MLGHASPAITLLYAYEFAWAEHVDRTRERMEPPFGELLREPSKRIGL